MGGGLLQLVAFGAQDAYITGNPHITFWKILYKRHTNFAMEAFRVNFTGAPTYGQRVVAVVNRNADLVWKTYVEVTLPDMVTPSPDVLWTSGAQRRLGYLLLKQIEVEIGGQIIDRHYGEWLYLWETLTADFNTAYKLDGLVGGSLGGTSTAKTACTGRPNVLYVPLQFWFNRNPGLALPLIALQYHEVRFNITLADSTDLVSKGAYSTFNGAANALPQLKDMCLYIDYVYLDVDERRRFAQESHEYLIDQVQFEGQQQITTSSGRLDLTLNHPVKELIWVFQDARYTDCAFVGQVTDPNVGTGVTSYTMPFTYNDIVNRARLQINGQDRFDERYGDYFWKVQPYQHHTAGGVNPNFGVQTQQTSSNSNPEPVVQGRANPINVYSFAISPEEHQPSGTCNFSRIDTATLVFDSIRGSTDDGSYPSKTYPYNFRMYAVNYNIFRIMSGMGGLAYSN
jgi:hypothetical protein